MNLNKEALTRGLKKHGLTTVVVLTVIVAFQNCGKGFEVSNLAEMSSLSSYDPQCLTSLSYDTCLFDKNPVYAGQSSQSTKSVAQVEGLQTHAVSLEPIVSGNRLQNMSFAAYEAGSSTPLAKDPNIKWNYRYSVASERSKLAQVSSFYWANFATINALNKTGLFYAQNRGIKIIAEDSVFGWVPAKNQIHLLKNVNANAMALDGSIVVYFLGLANLDYATNGKIHQFTKENHVSCATGARDCCATAAGCARAIASGTADYFVAMTFPQSPLVGDGFSDNVAGKSVCSTQYERSPESVATLDRATAYGLCGAQKRGDIYAMGSVYASVWYNVRNHPAANSAEVDRLFMLHLAQLNGDDDFTTAQSKIKAIDQANFGGKYSSLFDAEFARR